jgi:hypothetical protein
VTGPFVPARRAGRGRRCRDVAPSPVDVAPADDAATADEVRPGTRLLLTAFAGLTLLAVLALLVFSGRADEDFAWSIRVEITAAFLGAAFAAGCVLSLLSLHQKRWTPYVAALLAAVGTGGYGWWAAARRPARDAAGSAVGRPAQGRAELRGDVGEDLDVVLAREAERQREGDLTHLPEPRVPVQRRGDLLGGAQQVGGEQQPPRALR